MKTFPKLVAVGALAACTTAPTGALDFDTLTQRGMSPMTGQDIAARYVGNSCRTTVYDTDGNITGSGVNTYRTDGTVTKTITRTSGETVTRERTWRMSGGNFCETLFSSGEEWCEGHENFFLLDDTMYGFHEGGAVQFVINCG